MQYVNECPHKYSSTNMCVCVCVCMCVGVFVCVEVGSVGVGGLSGSSWLQRFTCVTACSPELSAAA